MAVFQYVAFDAAGTKQRGLIEADTARDARQRLRERRVFVSAISACEEEAEHGDRAFGLGAIFRRDRSAELAMPLRELATLLSAGVPLAQALDALANQSESASVERVFRGVREQVLAGESLSGACGRYPRWFGPVARHMIAAGEETGNLDAALRRLSGQLLRRRELMGKVASALVYPGILAAISLAVVVFLLSYVVPRISRVYLETGATLPLPTRILLGVSAFAETWWPAVLAALAGGWLLVRAGLKHERTAAAWDRTKLRLPFVGPVYRKQCVAEFARTLCSLLQAGVPLVEALRVTASTLANRPVADEIRQVADEAERGGDVSRSVRERGVFPETVAEMMAAGEESGEMVDLLEALAEDYEHQVEMTAERACRALEPLVVVLMGSVVLFIVLSVLLPIARLSQLVKV